MEKILIIEDEESYLENIRILLEEEGYDIRIASNGMDGIDSIKNECPDLIICDIMLPDIDGYKVLKEIRKRDKTKLIPFIFLTAKAEMSDLRTGMNLGADDYVIKPFRAEDLLAAIKTRLQKSKDYLSTIKKEEPDAEQKRKYDINDYLFLPGKSNYEVIPVSSVVCIISEGVYSNVFNSDGKKILVRKLLKEWEDQLPSSSFLRIHKSIMINKKWIKKVDKWFNGALKIHLEHYKEPLTVSRRYAPAFKLNK